MQLFKKSGDFREKWKTVRTLQVNMAVMPVSNVELPMKGKQWKMSYLSGLPLLGGRRRRDE